MNIKKITSGFCSLDIKFKKKILELWILQKVELFEHMNMSNFQGKIEKIELKYAFFYFVVK